MEKELFPTVDPGSVWADFTDEDGETIISARITRSPDGTITVHTVEHTN